MTEQQIIDTVEQARVDLTQWADSEWRQSDPRKPCNAKSVKALYELLHKAGCEEPSFTTSELDACGTRYQVVMLVEQQAEELKTALLQVMEKVKNGELKEEVEQKQLKGCGMIR